MGQGLAGTTLAWILRDKGQKVLLIDAGEPVTSSKIAAGLITPITGMRMVLSEGIEHFLPTARNFYRSVEDQTGAYLFHDRIALRLFSSTDEEDNWAKRCERASYRHHIFSPTPNPLLAPGLADTSHGGFAMRAAQLDVSTYLSVSHKALGSQNQCVDWAKDIAIAKEGVSVCGRKAARVISCEGYGAAKNPYFAYVPFIAAKGEILTVRFDRPLPPQSLHRGIWLAPSSEKDVFYVGSTYDWKALDNIPTSRARAEIEAKLTSFFHVPFEVIDHKAAVRPIISQSKALIGFHPEHANLGFFNGLGSKGSLHAPWYASQFAEHIVNGAPLDQSIDVRRQF